MTPIGPPSQSMVLLLSAAGKAELNQIHATVRFFFANRQKDANTANTLGGFRYCRVKMGRAVSGVPRHNPHHNDGV